MILIGSVQVRNYKGADALHVAVGTGSVNSVKVLLENDACKLGVNFPARGQNGQTPLDMASSNREIAGLLRHHRKL